MHSNSAYQRSVLHSLSSSSFSDSNSSIKDQQTLHTLIRYFFYKTCHLIAVFRSPTGSDDNSFDDTAYEKWFNIKLAGVSFPRDALVLWESRKSPDEVLPPLIIETYLDLRRCANTCERLYYTDDAGSDHQVLKFGPGRKNKSEIVLERWLVEITDGSGNPATILSIKTATKKPDVARIYQHGSAVLKSLFKSLSSQPATALKNRLDLNPLELLAVNYRVLDPSAKISSKGRIGLSKPVALDSNHIDRKDFDAVKSPYGNISISVSYRKDCRFKLNNNPETPSPDAFRNNQNDAVTFTDNHSLYRLRKSSTNSTSSLLSSKGDSKNFATPPQTPSSFASFNDKNSNSQSSTSINSVPNFHRSNSNVSLAALLRAQRNSFSSSNTSTNTRGITLNRHSLSPLAGAENEPTTGTGIRYSSSFSSSKLQRRSTWYSGDAETPKSATQTINSRSPLFVSRDFSLTRNFSFDSIGDSLSYTPSATSFKDNNSDLYSLRDFVKLIDSNKFKLKATISVSTGSSEHDALQRFQLMKTSNDVLSSDLSASLCSNDRLSRRSSSTNSQQRLGFMTKQLSNQYQFTAAVKNHLLELDQNYLQTYDNNASYNNDTLYKREIPLSVTSGNPTSYSYEPSFVSPHTPRSAKKLSFTSSSQSPIFLPASRRASHSCSPGSIKVKNDTPETLFTGPLIQTNVDHVYAKMESVSNANNVPFPATRPLLLRASSSGVANMETDPCEDLIFEDY